MSDLINLTEVQWDDYTFHTGNISGSDIKFNESRSQDC